MMEEGDLGKCIEALETCLRDLDEARTALNAPGEVSAAADQPPLWSIVAYGVFDASGKLIEAFDTMEHANVAKARRDLQHAGDSSCRVVPLYTREE